MKKCILALVLCVALLVSGALAEDAAFYAPGELSRSLFSAAFDAGKVITGDLTMTLDMDPSVLGVDEETTEIVRAVLQLLDDVHLRVGVGKIEDGLRLTVGATLDAPEGSTPVSADVAANVTWDGLSLESDLIPGDRVTAKWETLMALAGADESAVAIFSALRDVDWEAELNRMGEEFLTAIDDFADALDPYLAIVSEYLGTLPYEVAENVPAEDGYPAVPMMITFPVTAQNLAELSGKLVDQLEQDEVLLPKLEAALVNGNANMTLEDFIAALRKGIDNLSKEHFTVTIALGTSDSGFPLVIEAVVTREDDPDGMNSYLVLVVEPDDTLSNWSVDFECYSMNDAGDVGNAFGFTMNLTIDPDDPILEDAVKVLVNMYAMKSGNTVYSLDYSVATKGTTTDADLPAAQMELSETQVLVADESVIRTVASTSMLEGLTADGGEEMMLQGMIDSYVGDAAVLSMPFVAEMRVVPDGNGGVEGNEAISYSIASLGIDELTFAVQISSQDYDPASTEALTEIALEKVSQEEFSALVGRLSNAGMMKLFLMIPLLPEQLVNLSFNGLQ